MLRVYSVINGQRYSVEPKNNIFDVVEGFDYVLEYYADNILTFGVFIEDIPIAISDFDVLSENEIKSKKKKFFIDYFGFACLKVNNEEFLFNIKVEKFKINEIEEIFTFLWNKEESLFKNFFSKSTKKIKFDRYGNDIDNNSKYILFATHFIETFSKMYPFFRNQSHTKLVEVKQEKDVDTSLMTQYSIDWIFSNLDSLNFSNYHSDSLYSFKINDKTAILQKVGVEDRIDSLDTYENAVILGALRFFGKELKRLKRSISAIINVDMLQNKEYADFSDLKKIPFLKMYQESLSLEKKYTLLYNKYRQLFNNVPSKMEKPQLTAVFSSKTHYQKAYKLICNLYNYKFNLNGEFRFLNIRRLSQLYEVYNFHLLSDSIEEVLDNLSFKVFKEKDGYDNLDRLTSFKNEDYTINLYYEKHISDGSEIDLVRIDKIKGKYYNPDYILEIIQSSNNMKKYWILDSKYSKQSIVKANHLNSCMFKYLLNTGVKGISNQKVEGLILLFPSGQSEAIVESDFYNPTINMIVSKPKFEINILNCISKIMNKSLPLDLISSKYKGVLTEGSA